MYSVAFSKSRDLLPNDDKALAKTIPASQKPCDLVKNWPRYSPITVKALFVIVVIKLY